MIHGQSVLAVIPARGGSKRLPGKNLRLLGGRPLLAWSILAARDSRVVDHCVVSSEDSAILDAARSHGCDAVERPPDLAGDDSAAVDVVLHAMDALEDAYDWVVLLQPTSPLRTAADIDGCVAKAHGAGATTAIAVTEPERSPYLTFSVDDAGYLCPLFPRDFSHVRSQDLPVCYAVNGAAYVARTAWLREKHTFIHRQAVPYVMPRSRSVDIDTAEDFAVAEMTWSRTAAIT